MSEEYYVNPEGNQNKSSDGAGQNSNGNTEQEKEAEKRDAEDSQPHTYGAYYAPADRESGEYRFTPYTKTDLNDPSYSNTANSYRAEAAGNAKPPKKKSGAGRIIGITAAVLAVIITLSACSVGVMYVAKIWFGSSATESGTDGTTKTEAVTADNANVNNGDTLIQFSDSGNSEGSGTDGESASSVETNTVSTKTVAQGEKMSVEDAVDAVKDSVVEITTETVQTSRYYGQYVTAGAGSGVIISADGKIITNNHVIDGATKITVRLTDGSEFEATLVGTDEDEDIAVISINPGSTQMTAAVLGNSDELRTGQDVIVIGNPLGELGGSVSKGIVSATKREIAVDDVGTMTLIQTDASVNPGNSGGGMFNLYGELVGVVNSKYSDTDVEGLGFAIPINDAWTVASDLLQYGYVQGKVIMGLKGITIADETVQYSFSYGTCVVVTAVEDGSDFQVNDIITAIDGTSVSSVSDVKKVLKTLKAGDKVKVKVTRQYSMGFYTTSRSGYLEAEVYEIEQSTQGLN